MSDNSEKYDVQFFQLVVSLQAAAMQQMGKIISPLTGKIERDLDMAKQSIDMLEMIQRKSEGNLSSEEKQLLDRSLYELRMNYVEEVKKGPTKTETGTTESDEATSGEPEPTDIDQTSKQSSPDPGPDETGKTD